jgi:mRNA interferase RelE/StbE
LSWIIEWDKRAVKELKKLSPQAKRDIINYLNQHILDTKNPKRIGKPLKGNKFGLWRYRVGDYRIICHLEDERCVVLILRIAHRQSVYK